jgi:hypothetical protein
VLGLIERQQCGQSTVFEFACCPACDMVHIGGFVPLPEFCASKADEHNILSQNSTSQQQLRIFITRNNIKNAF